MNIYKKIIGFIDTIGQFIVATVEEETPESYKITDGALLAISAKDGQVNVNFIPIQLLSIDPVVDIKNMLLDPSKPLILEFQKKNLKAIFDSSELLPDLIANYEKTFGRVAPKLEENIVKLF